MELRKLLLRIMLWSLAFAATTGVLAILFSGGDLMARLVGTAAVTAAAAGLMLPVSKLVDREQTRLAGLVGIAGIVVEFLLALAVIWDLLRLILGASLEGPCLLTLLFFGLALAVVVLILRHRHEPRVALAWPVGTILTVLTFDVLMIASWHQGTWEVRDKWWETAGAVAATAALIALSLVSIPPRNWRNWRWAGVLAAVVAFVLWTGDIWIGSGSELGLTIFCASFSLACVLVHANLTLLCPLKPGQGWVWTGTVVAVAATAALIDTFALNDPVFDSVFDEDFLGRLAGAGGIVSSCGTLALAVLARLNRQVDYEGSPEEPIEIRVICPQCGKKQTIPLGEARCRACELRIYVRIEDPRCPSCGYLLYGLTSDHCPECGGVVASGGR